MPNPGRLQKRVRFALRDHRSAAVAMLGVGIAVIGSVHQG